MTTASNYENYLLLLYSFDTLRKTLSMTYGHGDGIEYTNKVDIHFHEVLAHNAECLTLENRIHGIEELEPSAILEEDTFYNSITTKASHFPIKYKTLGNLVENLEKMEIRYYKIFLTTGLPIIVFAKHIEYVEH